MAKFQEKSDILSTDQLAEGIFRLTLNAPRIAAGARPGQFVMVSCASGLDPLLRRPFSIHQVGGKGQVQLLFKVTGRGTALLARVRAGDRLSLVGPLGRGFSLTPGRVCLVGGGMGIAPLLFLASRLREQAGDQVPTVLLGARSASELLPLLDGFAPLGCAVHTATDDGSLGHHGPVIDLLPGHLDQVERVAVCGPFAMMAAAAALCRESATPCQVSLETHMACGLGACLGCTVHGADRTYRHVCKHGPVMAAEEVAWTR